MGPEVGGVGEACECEGDEDGGVEGGGGGFADGEDAGEDGGGDGDAEVLVVGASRGGIGTAIASAFRDAGANVRITGAEPAPDPDEGFGYTQLDVTDTDAVRAFAAGFPRLDVLVNCAAITRRGEEMDPAFFAHVLDVNLVGSLRCAEALQSALRGGAIINISTFAAFEPDPVFPTSGVFRAGLAAFAKLFADKYAADNVRMNNVLPGFINSLPEKEEFRARVPMGRYGSSRTEIGGTIAFLASDAAGYITGQNLRVDGGITRSV